MENQQIKYRITGLNSLQRHADRLKREIAIAEKAVEEMEKATNKAKTIIADLKNINVEAVPDDE